MLKSMIKQNKKVSISIPSSYYDVLMRMFPTTSFSGIIRYLVEFYFDKYKETFNVKD